MEVSPWIGSIHRAKIRTFRLEASGKGTTLESRLEEHSHGREHGVSVWTWPWVGVENGKVENRERKFKVDGGRKWISSRISEEASCKVKFTKPVMKTGC